MPQDEQAGEKSTPVRHYDVGMVTNVVSASISCFTEAWFSASLN
jgi:hypothetical protein